MDNSLLTVEGTLGGVQVAGGAIRSGMQALPPPGSSPAHTKCRCAQEHQDYVLLPAAAWELIELWYGGGPILAREAPCCCSPVLCAHSAVCVRL